MLSGGAVHPANKFFPSIGAEFPFSLAPGETRDFYFKAKYTRETPYLRGSIGIMYFVPGPSFLEGITDRLKVHFFFSGMFFLCGLVSIFMFIVFREKIFLYFAGLMFVLIAYFLSVDDELGVLLNSPQSVTGLDRRLIVFALLSALYLFIKGFLRLKENYLKLHRFYQSGSLAFLTFLLFAIVSSNFLSLQLIDKVILVWIVFSISIITYIAWMGDKAGRIMLLSILFFFLCSLAFILNLFGFRYTAWAVHSFRLGALLFSGVLFFGLFDRVNDIREAKRQAEEIGALKSNFFANITHEFRTPLTLMLGPLKQLLEGANEPGQRALLQLAHDSAERQLSLVNQILDLSKAESGQLQLRATEQDFIPFLKGTVFAYSSLAEQQEIDLQLHCPEDALFLFFDREKMEQIIYNLLSNAFKFTPPGGQIAVSLRPQNAGIAVFIQDSGMGIPQNRLEDVFNRFFREEAAELGNIDGYGIGLALVKELVQLHGGSISLESEVKVGTTVQLFFPAGRKHLRPEQIVGAAELRERSRALLPSTDLAPAAAPDNLAFDQVTSAVDASPDTHSLAEQNTLLLVEDNDDVRAFIRSRKLVVGSG